MCCGHFDDYNISPQSQIRLSWIFCAIDERRPVNFNGYETLSHQFIYFWQIVIESANVLKNWNSFDSIMDLSRCLNPSAHRYFFLFHFLNCCFVLFRFIYIFFLKKKLSFFGGLFYCSDLKQKKNNFHNLNISYWI